MRIVSLLSILFAGCLAAARPGPDTAVRAEVAPRWIRGVTLETRGECPPQWRLLGEVTMPTPGWKLTLDEVERPDAMRRVLLVTGEAPEGSVIQVLTPAKVAWDLGGLRKGATVVEIRYRAGKTKPYETVDALVVRGRYSRLASTASSSGSSILFAPTERRRTMTTRVAEAAGVPST